VDRGSVELNSRAMTFDTFISYPHEEKATADAACAALEGAGIRCWIAPRDVLPGDEWADAIVRAIDNCRVMVLIFCAYTNHSKQIHREVQRAFEGEKPVVPFRIEDVTPDGTLAYYMGSIHWLDALKPLARRHSTPCSLSDISGWRDGVLYPFARGRRRFGRGATGRLTRTRRLVGAAAADRRW
jgi:hypothetical protein